MNASFDPDFSISQDVEAPLLVIRMVIHMPHSHSLKEKRKVIRSLKERLSNRFNVSIAEVGEVEKWQIATLIAVMVGNDRRFLDEQASKIRTFVDGELIGNGELVAFGIQIV